MKFSHFKGIFKKTSLTVDSVKNPFGDYYVARLLPKDKLTWKAGEHGVFSLPGHNVEGKKTRVFSLASIPEEGYLTIGTRIGKKASGFKEKLIGLKKGDEMNSRGPFGWFLLRDETSPVVMIAGGVGITPIRALLKEMEKGNERQVEVVYSSGNGFLFEEEIKAIAEKDPGIKLHFTKSREETGEAVGEIAKRLKNKAYYYVSGNPKAIRHIKKGIACQGVSRGRIINDPFYGSK